MAEEAITAAPITATPIVDAAPVVAATPVIESVAPVVETVPVVEPVAEATKPLLSPEAPEAKTGEVEAVAEAPKPDAEPTPLPVYEFKLPEGADSSNEQFKTFNAKLGEFQNLSKAEQATVQKFGQEMIDMHMADVKSVIESQNRSAWDWFNNRNKEWLETAKKDPTIGGEAFGETVNAASQAISLYGGTKAQQLETAKLLQETGVENHPALLRFLANITRTAAKEGTPVSSRTTPIQKQGIAQAMYGKTSGGSA